MVVIKGKLDYKLSLLKHSDQLLKLHKKTFNHLNKESSYDFASKATIKAREANMKVIKTIRRESLKIESFDKNFMNI